MKTFKTFIHEAAFHRYLEWGWISPEGKIYDSVTNPEIKKYIEKTSLNIYKGRGIIHVDILAKFVPEYISVFKSFKKDEDIDDLIDEKIYDHALQNGWIRYFIESYKDGKRLVLNLPIPSKMGDISKIVSLVFSDNIIVDFDTIYIDTVKTKDKKSQFYPLKSNSKELLKQELNKLKGIN